MPDQVYEIQTPDGRIFEVQGPRAPTRADVQKMQVRGVFGPSKPQPPPTPAQPDELGVAMVKATGRNIAAGIDKWGEYGPHEVNLGLQDVWRGDVSKGARRVLSGAAVTAAPMVAGPALAAFGAAPAATTAAVVGGGALAVGAQKGVQAGGEALGLTPDQAGLAGDIAGFGTGAAAAKYGPPVVKAAQAAWQTSRRTARGAQSVVAWNQAIPATKSARYEPEDFHRASPYLDVEHAQSPIVSVERARDAADNAIGTIEGHIAKAIQANPNDLIRTNPIAAVRVAFADAPRSDALDKGLRSIRSLDLDKPTTIARADQLRHQLNAENKAVLKRNHYDVATARAADPAFKAREAAVRSLRDGVYQQLEARGIVGVKDLRLDEGSLIRIRNAAENQIFNATKPVSGTSPAGRHGTIAARKVTALGIRSTPGIPAVIADPLAAMIAPGNLTRDELVARAFKLRTPAAAPQMPVIPPGPVIRGALPAPAIPMGAPAPPPSGRVYNQPLPVIHPGGGPAALPPGRGARPEFHLPGEVAPAPAAAADPSGIRMTMANRRGKMRPTAMLPGQPLSYKIDPSVPVKPGGFRVAQLASHPDQAAEAVASSPQLRETLKHIELELHEMPFQPGKTVYDAPNARRDPFSNRPNLPGGGYRVEDAAGSPLGNDLRVIAESTASNADFEQAIADVLAGKPITRKEQTAVLDLAMGILEGRPGYRPPTIPKWAGQSSSEAAAAADDAAFEAWSADVDSVGSDSK